MGMTKRRIYLTINEIDAIAIQAGKQRAAELREAGFDCDYLEISPALIRVTWEILRDSYGASVAVNDE